MSNTPLETGVVAGYYNASTNVVYREREPRPINAGTVPATRSIIFHLAKGSHSPFLATLLGPERYVARIVADKVMWGVMQGKRVSFPTELHLIVHYDAPNRQYAELYSKRDPEAWHDPENWPIRSIEISNDEPEDRVAAFSLQLPDGTTPADVQLRVKHVDEQGMPPSQWRVAKSSLVKANSMNPNHAGKREEVAGDEVQERDAGTEE